MESETFLRNDSVVSEVDHRQRLITTLAVPWDEEAQVPWRGEVWNEVFRRGAFDGLEEHVGRVRVNRQHVYGDTVGKLVWADPKSEAGLVTRAKIVKSPRGDETLALAEEDMISASVGYRVKDPADININRRTKMREVLRAFLDHLSLVEDPTWPGAAVLEVRDARDLSETITEPPAFSRTLNDAWSDPDYLRALDRLNKAPSGG